MPRSGHRVTAKLKAAFLRHLAAGGNVRVAAKAVGFAVQSLYDHRHRDPAFAAAWEEAVEAAMDTVLEPEAVRRAVEGVEKPVYHQGQQVGTVREYSDTLLIFLLKGGKPDKYKDRREVFHRGTIALLEKLEQIAAMSPDELEAFLAEVEAHLHQREG
jgi:hypothetical protein